MSDIELHHMLRSCRAAREGEFGALPTVEKLAATVVLNRHDWLTQMNYTGRHDCQA
ncbi:hypothetical protein P0D75_38700 [Paraburkholderia sediminicola]|uniref:hypothetical protein n=1 Tax=Paraburkholderia sediminicola TaxID=458836 RepID=UPI0038BA5FC2